MKQNLIFSCTLFHSIFTSLVEHNLDSFEKEINQMEKQKDSFFKELSVEYSMNAWQRP